MTTPTTDDVDVAFIAKSVNAHDVEPRGSQLRILLRNIVNNLGGEGGLTEETLAAALATLGVVQSGSDPNISLWLKQQGQGTVLVGSSDDNIASPTNWWGMPLSLLAQDEIGYGAIVGLRSAGTSPTTIAAFTSGGTLAAPTVSSVTTTPFVGSDNLIIYGVGFDGENWSQSAQITLQNGPGTISPGNIPGQVILAANASSGPQAALTVMGDYGIQAIGAFGFAVTVSADDGINFEHIKSIWNGTVAEVGTVAGGTGTLRSLRLTGAGVQFPSVDPHIVGAWYDNGTTLVRSTG